MNRLRALSAVLLGGLLALGAATAAVPATAATATVERVLPVVVAANRISPAVLEPGQDLTVGVTLTNTGTTPVARPRAFVNLDRRAFVSRSSLDRWREAAPFSAAGTAVGQADLETPLAPGATASLTITVPAASIGLSSAAGAWGARGLAVEVVDAEDPTRIRLGVVRTFVVWFPPQEVTPTTLSVLVPFTGPVTTGDVPAAVAAQTAPGGRLSEVLRATAPHPGVTWAVDPALVATAAADDDSPGSSWARALVGATDGREVQLLPWGDADVAALTHTQSVSLGVLADELSRRTAADLGLPSSDVFSWPGGATTDLDTVDVVSPDGARAVVVAPGELLPPSVLTYTPTGATSVSVEERVVDLLVPDPELSQVLAVGMTAEQEAAGGADQVTGATAAAELLAELAIITRERPSDGRHVLATLPRDWSPVAAVADAQLSAIETAPWVRLAPVAELAATETPTVDRGTLPQREVLPTEVTAAELRSTTSTLEERLAIAAMGTDPAALAGDTEVERLAPAALAWRENPAGRAAVVAASIERTAALRTAVSVPPAGTVNLISTSGDLPLQVDNALDQDVTVVVDLRPTDSRLVADRPVEVTVPAGGAATVEIPVHGVQSADVQVVVELSTTTGVLVDSTTRLTVRVRADWENIGTGIVGGVLAIGLVVGLARTARRARGTRADRAAAAGLPSVPADEDGTVS